MWAAFIGSRLTWFAAGLIAGVLGALLLVWRTTGSEIAPPRTLSASAAVSANSLSLADALRDARPGDTIELERGIYSERVVLPDGVNLVARVPGTVTLARPSVSNEPWIAIETAPGDLGGRISGIAVESTTEQPIDVGVRVNGQDRVLELLQLTGPMHAAVEVSSGAAASLHGSHVAVPAIPIVLGASAQLDVTGSTFAHQARTGIALATLGDGAQASFKGNVFVGFGPDLAKIVPQAERQQFLAANVIVNPEPAPAR